ncbi:hypothetical protein ABW19_dt0209417 [Dactylella cylindrospora]|nr:hypothetical protein ABW19_dt0209417 [Dactylella cylindrospora]
MQTLAYLSLLLLSLPAALSNPVPDGTPSVPPITKPSPTPTTPICPYSSTVTVKPYCTLPACTNPIFCPAIIRIQEYPCECLKKKPTTTTVTAKCPSDCQCTIPTEYIPTGCPSTTSTTTTCTTTTTTRVLPSLTRISLTRIPLPTLEPLPEA